jgi:DNA polymerase-1
VADLLAVFDGNSLAHRAYHAMPSIWSHRGESNHAVYGFGSMLVKALDQLRPRYGAVAFDTPEPTFRHHAFVDYKAQRGAAPDDLYPQFDRIRELARGLGLACLECVGFEADDVLATLAHQAIAAGVEVVVVTGDTDALQLVGPGVRVLMPVKGFSETILFDEAAVAARCGVPPHQIAAWKALKGDSSDNIPGVPGIGERTAARLLAEHGALDALMAAVDHLSPKLRDTLAAHADRVERNHALTTVCREAPVTLDLASCDVRACDRGAAAAVLRSLGLGRLTARLPDYRPSDSRPASTPPRPKRTAKRGPGNLQLALF